MNTESQTQQVENNTRSGWFLQPGMILALLVSILLSFYDGWMRDGNLSAACGSASGVCVCALIVILVFSISPRYRDPRSRAQIVLLTSLVIIIASLGNILTNKTRALERIAQKINATSPKMIDAETRLEGAKAGPGLLLTLRETFVQIDGKSMDRNAWKTKFAPRLRENIARAMKEMLSSGVVVAYQFFGRDGVLIDEMQLTSKDVFGR